MSETKPRVLFVYYSHTQQAQRVCDAMAEVLPTARLRRHQGRD